jgi:hypothetical protein
MGGKNELPGLETNWYSFNPEAREWEVSKTEDHIFAPYSDGGRRIGDMTREELLQVIATGYHEREKLAEALRAAVGRCQRAGFVLFSDGDFADEIYLAESIIQRVIAELPCNRVDERVPNKTRDEVGRRITLTLTTL